MYGLPFYGNKVNFYGNTKQSESAHSVCKGNLIICAQFDRPCAKQNTKLVLWVKSQPVPISTTAADLPNIHDMLSVAQ